MHTEIARRAALKVLEVMRSESLVGENAGMGIAMRNDDGFISRAQLGSGTADSLTYLRGDKVWAVPPGGGGSPDTFTTRAKWADF